jgi:hypothetical protein
VTLTLLDFNFCLLGSKSGFAGRTKKNNDCLLFWIKLLERQLKRLDLQDWTKNNKKFVFLIPLYKINENNLIMKGEPKNI